MPDDSVTDGKLAWIGLRQMQSLRDALVWSLAGYAVDQAAIGDWLQQQGLDNVLTGGGPSLIAVIHSAIHDRRKSLLGADADTAIQRERRAAHPDTEDVGADRGGARWALAANFCITSAFLRLLGAWEQYELDVLKALVHYRPTGEALGPPAERMLIEPDLAVVHEEPVPDTSPPDERTYVLTPQWTQIRKKVKYNDKRRKYLLDHFQIETIPGADAETKNENDEWRNRWYEQRNRIAHGRANVTMTLSEYVNADVFIYRSVIFVAEQCREKHSLLV